MSMLPAGQGYALGQDDGDLIWFLDTLMEVKAGGEQTGGAFTVIEWAADKGFAPPPHIHRFEEESFYVLEGRISVTCGDQQFEAEPGSFVYLPKRVMHTFDVRERTRALQITAPSGFERFIEEVGLPASGPSIPEASPPDVEKLLAVSERYGIEILLGR